MTAHAAARTWTLRPTTGADEDLLWWFLMMASYSPDLESVKAAPIAARHVEGWGREGDFGVIAEDGEGTALGACWSRWLDPGDSPYAEIQTQAPDLALAVSEAARGMGLGEALLRAHLAAGLERTPPVTAHCLNVRATNAAARLYERVGFQKVPGAAITNLGGGVSWVMLWRADP